ncbi:MAG: SRPBCC family protein [Cyanobacteria bacterium P01_F01_bin.86]
MQSYTLKKTVEVDANCSLEDVYNLWDNLENIPRWIPLVKEVKILPGTKQLSRWKFGLEAPLQTEWTSHIIERIPMKLIAWESISGLPNHGCAQFFPSDRGCRLNLTLSFDVPGGIVGFLIKGIGVDRWLEANLVESLKLVQSLMEKEIARKKSLNGPI